VVGFKREQTTNLWYKHIDLVDGFYLMKDASF